jgi:phosphoserine phosphatase
VLFSADEESEMTDASIRRLVLADWDNTFRKGFTVVNWAQFLADRGLFTALASIKAAVERFHQGGFSYEEFCRRMASAYAAGLVGLAYSDVFAAAASFVALDSCHVFNFVKPLCAYLATQNLKVVVVSGAPEEPLSHYANSIGFELGGALRLKVEDGRYTGSITENCGLGDEKEAAVGRLSLSGQIAVALGDSTSDLPLLEAAPVGFVVLGAEHNSIPSGPNLVAFASEIDPHLLIELVIETLR